MMQGVRGGRPLMMAMVSAVVFHHIAWGQEKEIPVIDTTKWVSVAGNPDLGPLSTDRQQPVDFGIWQAGDGTWQIWSCIRNTKEPGKTRLFYGWQSNKKGVEALQDANWKPAGIKMQANPQVGEVAGGMQAPHVIRPSSNEFVLLYGDWENICKAQSKDGKAFERVIQPNISKVTAMFSEGAGMNTRDAMTLKIGDTFYCYYTACVGFRDEPAKTRLGGVYCRTSKDLKHWSASTLVSRGGKNTGNGWYDHECPFVVKRGDTYFLCRTQRYGKKNISAVYRSKDPLNFGVDDDSKTFVCRLEVAAPEFIEMDGQWFVAALKPGLDGIRIAPMTWKKQ